MATSNLIFQNQGRLKITLDTGIDLADVYKTEIEYITPSGKEVVIGAAVIESTKLVATIVPLDNESGQYKFHSRITILEGDLPVFGRPVVINVSKKWDMAIPPIL